MIYLLALLVGVIAGLRVSLPLALVTWAAHAGWLHLEGTRLAFLGSAVSRWVLTLWVLFEFVFDQLPTTKSRKLPLSFAARILSGAICGAAIGLNVASPLVGALLGMIGAVLGTYGGSAARDRLAHRFGRDRPAAFVEDVAALGLTLLVAVALL
jgi:uncharacterized membrane protein